MWLEEWFCCFSACCMHGTWEELQASILEQESFPVLCVVSIYCYCSVTIIEVVWCARLLLSVSLFPFLPSWRWSCATLPNKTSLPLFCLRIRHDDTLDDVILIWFNRSATWPFMHASNFVVGLRICLLRFADNHRSWNE